jgi:hypothetical protein
MAPIIDLLMPLLIDFIIDRRISVNYLLMCARRAGLARKAEGIKAEGGKGDKWSSKFSVRSFGNLGLRTSNLEPSYGGLLYGAE